MDNPIRLFLADDEVLLRRCLSILLNKRRGFQVVGEADNVTETLELAQAANPDVIVIEPEMPDAGPKVVEELRRLMPDCAVMVLARNDHAGWATQALRAGARGYIRKTCEFNDLVRAIERVHAGEITVATVEASALLSELGGDGANGSESMSLTTRELDVLRLIARGWTNSAIALELSITEHTVKGHLVRISNKLELDNRVQLATYAIQQGLATPTESLA